MPHTAAQRARGVSRDRHKGVAAPLNTKAAESGRLGAIKSNLLKGHSVEVRPEHFDTPEKRRALTAVLASGPMLANRTAEHRDRIDFDQWNAVAYAAKASRGLVRRLLRYAHDPRRKDAVRAAQVVLSVAGLMDGATAKAADPGDPRDMSADGIRRMVYSAQARLSALEAVAERLSDAPSGPQAPQGADLDAQSAGQSPPEAGKTPETGPQADAGQPEAPTTATVQPGSVPAPFE